MEKLLGILVVKVLAAQAVDTAHDQGMVVRVLLQCSADLERQVASIGAIRVTAIADNDGADVLEHPADFFRREGSQDVQG